MRARNVKPGFFKNSKLGKLSAHHRILFAGLWCMADARGRLKDDPDTIKIEVLPYDNVDVDSLLSDLESTQEHFISRYEVDGHAVIQINNFEKHQNPHLKERQRGSAFPPSPGNSGTSPEKNGPVPEEIEFHAEPVQMNPDILIPESMNPESTSTSSTGRGSGQFFKINLRGQEMREDEWVFRCLLERRRNAGQSLQGCDNLQALLSLYPNNYDHYKRWVLKPIEVRIAAFVLTALDSQADDPLKYATKAAEEGQDWEKMPGYLRRAKEIVESGDLEVVING